MEEFNFIANSSDAGQRIDKFLSQNIENVSRSYIHKLIACQKITVNGETVNKNYKLESLDKIHAILLKPKPIEALPEDILIDVVYEDDDLLVVNKAKDMVVHPAPGNYRGTLVNALLYRCKDSLSGINGAMRPGIVHRIDKDTSGLLIVAKNDNAHQMLALQIKNHDFTREYEAIVYGKIKDEEGTIRANIARSKKDRKKMAVVAFGGRSAVTHYRVLNRFEGFTHLRLKLETGRTHQIRVHMAYLGHPVLGDEVYSNPKNNPFKFLKGQCLHAKTIGFVHPVTKKYVELSAPLPDYFEKVIKKLRATQDL